VDDVESKRLVDEFHGGFCGGHFAAKTSVIYGQRLSTSLEFKTSKTENTRQTMQWFLPKQKKNELELIAITAKSQQIKP